MATIKPATSNVVTGTGTITIPGGSKFGGFDMSCDGTNLGTVVIKDTNSSGTILYNSKSVVGKVVIAPTPCSGTIYYSVSGTGCDIMPFYWD